jgi:hypothetical protein
MGTMKGTCRSGICRLFKRVFSKCMKILSALLQEQAHLIFNLNSYSEYKEFPGGNLPIVKGYSSIVQALASKLPNGMIQFGKKVVRVKWSCDGLEDSKFSEPPSPPTPPPFPLRAPRIFLNVQYFLSEFFCYLGGKNFKN